MLSLSLWNMNPFKKCQAQRSFGSNIRHWTPSRLDSYADSFPKQTTCRKINKIINGSAFHHFNLYKWNYLGFHSSFFDFIAFRTSRCFSSRRVFSKAAPSMSPVSSLRMSGRSRESVGHSLFGGFISGISFNVIANNVNW